MAEEFTWEPRIVDELDRVKHIYYWQFYAENFLLVVRYLQRIRPYVPDAPPGVNLRIERDYGFWAGYVGRTDNRPLWDYIKLHRGPRSWMNSRVIPQLNSAIAMVGFTGQNFDDMNIRPDGSTGYYMKSDNRPLVRLDKDSVFEILRMAVDAYLVKPELLVTPEPQPGLKELELQYEEKKSLVSSAPTMISQSRLVSALLQ
jgi:hypothetical protein